MAIRKTKTLEGLVVVDAKKPRWVTVLLEDIKGACPSDPCKCAIARALRREGAADARVTSYRAYVREKGSNTWTRYVNHDPITKMVQTFDIRGTFIDGKLRLDTPVGVDKLGGRHNRPTNPAKKGSRAHQRIYVSMRALPRITTSPTAITH